MYEDIKGKFDSYLELFNEIKQLRFFEGFSLISSTNLRMRKIRCLSGKMCRKRKQKCTFCDKSFNFLLIGVTKRTFFLSIYIAVANAF